jgi:hypothetical protein
LGQHLLGVPGFAVYLFDLALALQDAPLEFGLFLFQLPEDVGLEVLAHVLQPAFEGLPLSLIVSQPVFPVLPDVLLTHLPAPQYAVMLILPNAPLLLLELEYLAVLAVFDDPQQVAAPGFVLLYD